MGDICHEQEGRRLNSVIDISVSDPQLLKCLYQNPISLLNGFLRNSFGGLPTWRTCVCYHGSIRTPDILFMIISGGSISMSAKQRSIANYQRIWYGGRKERLAKSSAAGTATALHAEGRAAICAAMPLRTAPRTHL